ncbi:OmpA family protein [Oceanicola sp. S124]|uniref:OmpA family protein n=1 Tax=Oceanicola sp. S124 TaxID=1042378 RepID=UPI0002558168|nr:OmpA family protein [Oceanicola sp. S124]
MAARRSFARRLRPARLLAAPFLAAPFLPPPFLAVTTLAALAPPVRAQPFASLPYEATETFLDVADPDSYGFPTGPSRSHDRPPTEQVEGAVTRRAWLVPGNQTTSLQLLAPLRDGLAREGWQILLDCDSRTCGGFDFRFAIEVIPAPAMAVDLFDFRALTAARGDERIFLLTSQGDTAGHVQLIHAGPASAAPLPAPPPSDALPPGSSGAAALIAALRSAGHAALDDLRFATGEVALEETPAPSLSALAAFLRDTPDARLLLVGHTDSDGPLDTNRAVSQRRAEAVRRKLIELGVAPDRLEAHGVGYLAPRASNATDEGRRANRRVEAVLLSNP